MRDFRASDFEGAIAAVREVELADGIPPIAFFIGGVVVDELQGSVDLAFEMAEVVFRASMAHDRRMMEKGVGLES
jgi:hypothetical protein